jgi:exodeoxyribonuclease VII large subunit
MRGSFRVQGEIANISKRGHWYFSVKDAGAVLSCVMWQSDAARAVYDPREGDGVVVTGRIKHYAPQGKTQLYASKIEPQGVGALEQRFQQLVRELRGLGYFDESRKKPLPEFPRRVAVITSKTGAALQDVLKTAAERCPAVEFIVIDVRVQGDGAAEEVARALRAINRMAERMAIDAVIVTRGGGSREDLWAFNERVVADAAFALRVPLVAAIGHEVDTSVIELVADQRASTPTQAVMKLLPDLASLAERRGRIAHDLRNAMRWAMQAKREHLAELAASSALESPALRLAHLRARLGSFEARSRSAMGAMVVDERRNLDAVAARLIANTPAARAAAARAALAALRPRLARAIANALGQSRRDTINLERRLRSAGPAETLSRGYAIVTTADGSLLRSIAVAPVGTVLNLQLSDGNLPVRVEIPEALRKKKDA